jgi:hypothetical protein
MGSIDVRTFSIKTWFVTLAALLMIQVYRISLGDWAGFREASLAASAWCSLSAVGLMILR